MKKTIAVTLALVALAVPSVMADTLGAFGFATDASKNASVTIKDGSSEALSLTLGELTIVGEETSGYLLANASSICPNVNIGNGATENAKSWTQQFTLSNEADTELTLTSVTLNLDGLKQGGAAQNGTQKYVGVIFTAGDVTYTWSRLDVGNDNESDNLTFTFEQAISLASDADMDFSVKAFSTDDNTNGTYLALSGISFAGTMASAGENVPEPATSTLSLLALAGLASRRRRK